MKKLLSMVLVIVLTFSIGVMAFATDGFEDGNTMEVSCTTDEYYMISIPADQEITTSTSVIYVEAYNVLLGSGKELIITMTSANGYKMCYDDSEINYTAVIGQRVLSGKGVSEILSIAAGEIESYVAINLSTTVDDIANAIKAGKHTDTLTFECEVVDARPQ